MMNSGGFNYQFIFLKILFMGHLVLSYDFNKNNFQNVKNYVIIWVRVRGKVYLTECHRIYRFFLKASLSLLMATSRNN